MKKSSITRLVCGAAFSVAAAVSLSVNAEGYDETRVVSDASALPRVTVSYEDLDLNSVEGQETLHRRLSRAAREVCGSSNLRRVGSLARATANKNCYDQALAEAVQANSGQQVATVLND